jgi:hypothetical protein
MTFQGASNLSVDYDQYQGRLIASSDVVPVHFGGSMSLALASADPVVYFPHFVALTSFDSLDSQLQSVRFANLSIVASNDFANVVADELHFETAPIQIESVTVNGLITIEPFNSVAINNLSLASDTTILIKSSSVFPFLSIGGSWAKALKLKLVIGSPVAISGDFDIQIVCFENRNCVEGDLSIEAPGTDLEFTCKDQCAVLQTTLPSAASHKWVYIVIGVVGGVFLIVMIGVVVYVIRRRRRTVHGALLEQLLPTDDPNMSTLPSSE